MFLTKENVKSILEIVFINRKGKKQLRKSKPKIKQTRYVPTVVGDYSSPIMINGKIQRMQYVPNNGQNKSEYFESDYIDGCAAYVWRMLAFSTGINNHMPVMAQFDIPIRIDEPKEYETQLLAELDYIVSAMEGKLGNSELHGLNQWARAIHGKDLPGCVSSI